MVTYTGDYSVFPQWFNEPLQFSYTDYDSIVSVVTGLVADKQVNCGTASRIDSHLMKDVKLSLKGRVWLL